MRIHVDIFTGVGMMSLAAERMGYTTTHCVEIDPFCQRILHKRFPDALTWHDIRDVGGSNPLALLPMNPDLMTVCTPCQGLSSAGLGAGLADPRSAMWFEGLRLIRETRPKLVLIENVAALRSRGLDVVVRGLADAGYGCWWDCVPALAVGAPHLRDRIWITAVPSEQTPLLEINGGVIHPDDTKWPRAGLATQDGAAQMTAQATIHDCKLAAGAVKRDDGVTWLTTLDAPLFPTPSQRDWKDTGNGRMGRRQLLEYVRDHPVPLLPTPTVGDSRNSRNATAGRTPGSKGHSGTTLSDYTRLWPTPKHSDAGRDYSQASRYGNGSRRSNLKDALRHTDPKGSLSPDWTEALMLMPVGWTDPDVDEPVPVDWAHGEPLIPRVAAGVEHRKDRLCAIGNALVAAVAETRLEQAHRLLGIDKPIDPMRDPCPECGAPGGGRCRLEGGGDCPEGVITPEQW